MGLLIADSLKARARVLRSRVLGELTVAQKLFQLPPFLAAYEHLRESLGARIFLGISYRSELDFCRQKLQSARRVLDLACGQGSFSVPIAALCSHGDNALFVGLDLSRPQLARAKRKIRHFSATTYRLIRGNAFTLPLKDAAMDGVICVGGLHQFPDPEIACQELGRVLAPGGVFVGGTFVLPKWAVRGVGMTPVSDQDLRRWFAKAGFEEVEIRFTSPIYCVFCAKKPKIRDGPPERT